MNKISNREMDELPTKTEGVQPILTCAALLAQHRQIHQFSMVTSALSVATLIILRFSGEYSFGSTIAMLSVVLFLAVIELIYSIRLGFDNKLLVTLANQLKRTPLKTDDNSTLTEALHELDNALINLQLMPKEKAGRQIDNRLNACMGLFKRQGVTCICQVIALAFLVTQIQ